MQFDFSALDAELENLGHPREDVLALTRKYAPLDTDSAGNGHALDQVDRALAALESDGAVEISPGAAQAVLAVVQPWSASLHTSSSRDDGARAPVESVRPAPVLAPAWQSEPPPAPLELAPSQPVLSARGDSEPPRLQTEPPSLRDAEPPAEVGSHADPHASTSEFPASAAAPPALTQSQEIVLPDPIARDELSTESGELRLDGDEPSSGSFELPETPTEPRIGAEELPSARSADVESLVPFDEVQDALEGSQPIMLAAARSAGGASFSDRDPDAEFDALLSEATDPRGIPTGARSGANGDVDTEDLLRGLEGDELTDEVVSVEELTAADAPHEAELLTRSLFEDAGDSTEITDRGSLMAASRGAAQPAEDDEAVLDDELDSGELEIVMEDDDSATIAPPPSPQSSKAPPPPPGADKRPSLLGRLFNKRDNE